MFLGSSSGGIRKDLDISKKNFSRIKKGGKWKTGGGYLVCKTGKGKDTKQRGGISSEGIRGGKRLSAGNRANDRKGRSGVIKASGKGIPKEELKTMRGPTQEVTIPILNLGSETRVEKPANVIRPSVG